MKKILKLIKSRKFILIFSFIFFFAISLFLNTNFGDDLWFKERFKDGIFEFLKSRYNIWSSRLVIEFFLVVLLQFPKVIWCLLNSLVIVLLEYSISELFLKDKKYTGVVLLLLILYPWREMSSAGWIATTLNYLWPLSFGMYTFISIKKVLNDEKISVFQKITMFLSCLYASNQEQMCALLFGFFTIFIIYLFVKKKKNLFIFILYFIILASLIMILTCPGNSVRAIKETATWYPQFENFNIVQKSILSLCSTTMMNIRYLNLLLCCYSLIMIFVSFKNKKSFSVKCLSIVLFVFVSLGLLNYLQTKFGIFEGLSFLKYFNLFTVNIDTISIYIKDQLFIIVISILYLVSLVLTPLLIIDKNNRPFIFILLIAGIASRFIMGFSPTVFASGMRTFIFFDFALLICIIYTLKEVNKNL